VECVICKTISFVHRNGTLEELQLPPDTIVQALPLQAVASPARTNTSPPSSKHSASAAALESVCSNKCGKPVTCLCKECNSNLCNSCYASIHSFPALSHHTKQPLKEVNNVKIEAQKCARHNVEITMICTTCLRPVCYDCFQAGIEHFNHDCISIPEYNKKRLAELNRNFSLKLSSMKKDTGSTSSFVISKVGQPSSGITENINSAAQLSANIDITVANISSVSNS